MWSGIVHHVLANIQSLLSTNRCKLCAPLGLVTGMEVTTTMAVRFIIECSMAEPRSTVGWVGYSPPTFLQQMVLFFYKI